MVDLYGAFAKSGNFLENLSGYRTGTKRKREWGFTEDAYIGNYGDNSLLYFHQYQNAAAGIHWPMGRRLELTSRLVARFLIPSVRM